jgi:hypothetical protein
MMRKALFAGLSVLSLLAAPASAFAHERHGYYGPRYDHRYYHRHDDHGDAVAAGVIGLAIGAVIGSAISDHNDRYYGPPPRYDRYDDGPAYRGDGYYPQGQCFRRELVWDPRTRQNIEVTHPYAC